MNRTTARFAIALLPFLAAGLLFGRVTNSALQTGPNFAVNSLADSDDGSCDTQNCTLREAINAANTYGNGASITFSVSGTIVLTSSLPAVGFNCTISGAGQSVVISGNDTVKQLLTLYGSYTGVTLDSLTFEHAKSGCLLIRYVNVSVTNCTFDNNNATYAGGGFTIDIGDIQYGNIANCTFYNNTGGDTGGIFFQNYTTFNPLTITNCTFWGNAALTQGGLAAADLYLYGATKAIVQNCIFANNLGLGPHVATQGAILNADSSNLCDDNSCDQARVVSTAQLKLDTPKNNGGPTKTIALLAGSVAINTGNNSYAGASPVNNRDQRGYDRVRSSDPTCDVGAYEFGSSGSLTVTTASDVSSANANGLNSLRTALAYAQTLSGAQTITFSPALSGQTITLHNGWTDPGDFTVLRVNSGQLSIQGLTTSPGVTIAIDPSVQKRHLYVANGASLDVSNLTFTGGTGDYGGSMQSDGTLGIHGCTFTGNTATTDGGAVHGNTGSPSLLIENSTFSANSCTGGQSNAIATGAQQTTLRYLTITNNSGGGSALLIYQYPTMMVDCLVDGNGPDGVIAANGATFSAQSTNNILGSGGTGGLTNGTNGNQTGVALSQLKLGALANNGGPTQTIPLGLGSLAIDAGAAISGLTSDQLGTSRPQGYGTDVGAFELVQTQAATPIISPASGTYENSVQVSISEASPSTTVRYTTDGTTPSETNGQIYAGPFALTVTNYNQTQIQAIAYARGYFDSTVSSATYSVLPPLFYWYNLQGIPTAPGALDLGSFTGDGVPNLLKYAFNMAPNAGNIFTPNVQMLTATGTAGLPLITRDAQGHLVIEFIRRTAASNPGVIYTAETSTDLVAWTALDLSNASVAAIDSDFERVTVTDPTITPLRFGRVRVANVEVYWNVFTPDLGPASLYGSAMWVALQMGDTSREAVELTDNVTSQAGSVIFNGIVPGYSPGGFTAQFSLQLGPTTSGGTPGDGASFAVGDLPAGPWGEPGPLTSHSLAIGFDTYDNGGTGSVGIHVWVNGTHVAVNATNPFTSDGPVAVQIYYDPSGKLTVIFNNTTIFNQLPITGFSLQPTDRFGMGARTGAATEQAFVYFMSITPFLGY